MTHTEASVLKALRDRHRPKKHGNGPEWAYVQHVRNRAGFNASRTLDAMALGLWPSRGMELHGYEVKVSRADFRTELRDVGKMDAFAHVLDRFWVVAPRGIVPRDELPATWGLLEVNDDQTIRQKVAAPLLTKERAPIPRDFLVPLLRAAGTTIEADDPEVTAAREQGWTEGYKDAEKRLPQWKTMYDEQTDHLTEARNLVREINDALGFPVNRAYRREDRDQKLAQVAATIRAVMNGEDVAERARNTIARELTQLSRITKNIQAVIDNVEKETGIKWEEPLW